MLIFSSSELVEPHIIPLKVRLGVDHLIFDGGGGGCANPKKNIEHMFLVKKKFPAEFLRRKKNRAASTWAWQRILRDA